ncbi:MAG: DUF433 domain-containing protein [Anaerolineae bacterium]
MKITDRIEVDPEVCQGKPVIRGTRIPVYFFGELGLTNQASTMVSLRDDRKEIPWKDLSWA